MPTFQRAGLRFDHDDLGPRDGSPVVLLHGFPQNRGAWSEVAPALVAEGYRVLVPDQRGYSPAARPRSRRAYRQGELVADVLALLDDRGIDRAHVVGHDWGGVVAWSIARSHPERLLSLTAVSTPHPRALARAALRGQLLRSWYAGLFQLPRLPEQVLTGRLRPLGERWLRASGLDARAARRYLDALDVRAALAWYRALPLDVLRDLARGGAPVEVDVPTLHVWGEGDAALGLAAAEATERCVRGPYRFVRLAGVSHWIPEQAPDRLLDALVPHLARWSGDAHRSADASSLGRGAG